MFGSGELLWGRIDFVGFIMEWEKCCYLGEICKCFVGKCDKFIVIWEREDFCSDVVFGIWKVLNCDREE